MIGLIHANRPAKHKRQIGLSECLRRQLIDTGLPILNLKPLFAQHRFKQPQPLKTNVADGNAALTHDVPPLFLLLSTNLL